jgi:arginyl-tRNA synthetase
MQTVLHQLDHAFRAAIMTAVGFDSDPQLTVAQNERFGDYQSNAAMGLARQVAEKSGQKANPRALAEQIRQNLQLGEMAEDVSIAGPGFINVRLSSPWLAGQARQLLDDDRLGIPSHDSPQRVVVDYSGPNIAKQMHVGHLRSTIIGDAIARTLAFLGHHIIRQNHIGDWGLQMGMVTCAVEELAGDQPLDLHRLEQLYRQVNERAKDPSVRQQMAERTRALQQAPREQLHAWQSVREITLRSAHDLYGRLNVTLEEADVRGESFYADQYEPMIAQLRARAIAVETEGAIGIFPPGFKNKEGEPRPFIIQSRDGTYQYPTFDLAALHYRINQLQAGRIIYTHDSRQAEHFAMLFAVADMIGLTGGGVKLEYAPFGTVLGEDGRPLKTREGENVKLADLLDEAEQRAYQLVTDKSPELPEDQRREIARAVGIGAVKYADLSKERTSDYVFSWDRMLAMDGNTGPYLQYAYARIRSIFRKAAAAGAGAAGSTPRFDSPHELSLLKHILRLPEIIQLIDRELKPHHLCTYLYELATRFSGFYENCPVLQSEEPTRGSRLMLSELTARTLARGLDLLGIEHPEQM